jgi:hypothetical protein
MSHVARAILGSFPVAAWRSARAVNHVVLTSRLAQVGWARVLAPADGDSVPFSCVFVVDSAQLRERARRYLIAANIFPAVLWPLEQTVMPIGHEARDVSRRLLSVHCDGRYGTPDMLRIGEILAGMAGA